MANGRDLRDKQDKKSEEPAQVVRVCLVHQVCAWYSSGPSRTGTNAKFGWLREAKRENTRSGL